MEVALGAGDYFMYRCCSRFCTWNDLFNNNALMKNIDIKLGDIGVYRKNSLRFVKKTWSWNVFEVILYIVAIALFMWFVSWFDVSIQRETPQGTMCKPQGLAKVVEAEIQPESIDEVQASSEAVGKEVKVTATVEKRSEVSHIHEWVQSTVKGSPIGHDYIQTLYRASNNDMYLTRLAVAIAYAETTLGVHPAVKGKMNTNWMGYDIRNGYDPKDLEVFAERLMRGLEYYRGVESNRALADRYTGSHNTDTWLVAVNESLEGTK